jgi:hypothetical protein
VNGNKLKKVFPFYTNKAIGEVIAWSLKALAGCEGFFYVEVEKLPFRLMGVGAVYHPFIEAIKMAKNTAQSLVGEANIKEIINENNRNNNR